MSKVKKMSVFNYTIALLPAGLRQKKGEHLFALTIT